jgi:hypothetical protein
MAHVMGWIRTAKETLPAINHGPNAHGPNAVTPEQIARLSALLDRMQRRALALVAQTAGTASEAGPAATEGMDAASEPAVARGRRAA